MRKSCAFGVAAVAVFATFFAQVMTGADFKELYGNGFKLNQEKKPEEALEAYQAALAAASTSKEKTACLQSIAGSLEGLGRVADARESYIQALHACSMTDQGSFVAAARALTKLSASDTDLKENVTVIEKEGARVNVAGGGFEPIECVLGTCYFLLGDTDKAMAIARDKIARNPDDHPWKGEAYVLLARCLDKQGKYADMLDALICARRSSNFATNPETITALDEKAVKGVSEAGDCDKVCGMLRDCLSRSIRNRAACYMVQSALVDVLMGAGRSPDALHEAKVLVETSVQANMPKAVATTAALLKAVDGNLKRANTFLEYQKFLRPGPDGKLGTADDLQNPLATIQRPDNSAWDAKLRQVMESYPKTWNGYLDRARVCRYMENPAAALHQLKLAFALAPMENAALQQVTDETVEVLLNVIGDVNVGKQFVDYQKCGTAGVDGKPGTADDLKNPVDECLAVLEPAQPTPAPKP